MLDTKARAELTRDELISYHLRLLALIVDPKRGHLTSLADEIGVHVTTLSEWSAKGYVPWFQCQKLKKKFGKSVLLDELCPEEFRTA